MRTLTQEEKRREIKKKIKKMCIAAFYSNKPWTEVDNKKRNALLRKLAKLEVRCNQGGKYD